MSAIEYNLSFDLLGAIGMAKHDPELKTAMIQELLDPEPRKLTNPIGACNQGTPEDPQWSSLWMRTKRNNEDGSFGGFVKVPKNGRMMLRLAPQKQQVANAGELLAAKPAEPAAPTPNETLAQLLANPELRAQLTAALGGAVSAGAQAEPDLVEVDIA